MRTGSFSKIDFQMAGFTPKLCCWTLEIWGKGSDKFEELDAVVPVACPKIVPAGWPHWISECSRACSVSACDELQWRAPAAAASFSRISLFSLPGILLAFSSGLSCSGQDGGAQINQATGWA